MQERQCPKTFGFLVTDTARLLRRRFDQKAREHGMTGAQWRVLAYVNLNEGINQATLADLMEVEPITLCRLVDKLEEAELLERRPDPGDRRARLLYITEKAPAVLVEMRSIADEVYREIFVGLSEQRREAMVAGLELIRANLSSLSERAVAVPSAAS